MNRNDLTLDPDLFIIPDHENYILYSPKGPSALYVNPAVVEVVQDFSQDASVVRHHGALFEKLYNAGLVCKKGSKASLPLKFNKPGELFDPDGVSLFLTTNCSMRCIYCYSFGGERHSVLPMDYARGAVDLIFDHAREKGKKHLTVNFHGGGEVSTEFPLLKDSVNYIRQKEREHSIKVSIQAGLNGVMGSEVTNWVIANIDSATLSLDGSPDVQNRQRPLSNGKDSYKTVAECLSIMDDQEFDYGIRMTVTSGSLESLPDSVAHIAETFSAKHIQAEPMFHAGRALRDDLEPIDSKTFVEKFRLAERHALSHGKRLKYSGARLSSITNIFCKALTGNSFAVTPEGLITACYEVTEINDSRSDIFICGHVQQSATGQFFKLDQEKIQRLKTLSVENKPFCQKCFCKYHCAGDCPAKLTDPWNPGSSSRCYINQELTKDQIKRNLLKMEF